MPDPDGFVVPVALAVAALGALVAAFGTGLAWSRRRAARRGARPRAQVSVWRPRVLELLDEEQLDAAPLDRLNRRAAEVFEQVVIDLLPQVRGEDQLALRQVLVRRGAFDEARQSTRSRRRSRRAAAAELLGITGDRRAIPELTALLGDPSVRVRSAAARALGKLGHPGAVPFLLAGLGGRARLAASDVTVAINHIGPKAVPGLRAALALPAHASRRFASELLGRLGAADAVDDLRRRLTTDEATDVRTAAAYALGRIEHPRAVGDLRGALGADRPEEVRAAAAWALARLGEPAAESC